MSTATARRWACCSRTHRETSSGGKSTASVILSQLHDSQEFRRFFRTRDTSILGSFGELFAGRTTLTTEGKIQKTGGREKKEARKKENERERSAFGFPSRRHRHVRRGRSSFLPLLSSGFFRPRPLPFSREPRGKALPSVAAPGTISDPARGSRALSQGADGRCNRRCCRTRRRGSRRA